MSKFIAIDGIDGVGKSTQIQKIVDHLESGGHQVVSVRDPGSTEIGSRLRAILLDSDLEMHRRTEAMLFMASRCEMIQQTILPALREGKVVVSDRFLLSTVVYQSTPTSRDEVSGVDTDTLWSMGNLSNAGLRPDLMILLDMPAKESIARQAEPADRMESRGEDYMERVRQAFRKQLPFSSDQTVMVDASQPQDAVSAEIIRAINRVL